MAICAKHLKVSGVGLPVFQAPRPRPSAVFRPNFSLGVQMVKLKNANVGYAAAPAGSTKRINNVGFGFPVGFLLAPLVCCRLAFFAAVARRGFSAAAQARAAIAPSGVSVATRRAKPRRVPARATLLNVELVAATLAVSFFAGLGAIRREAFHALVPRRTFVGARACVRAILSPSSAGKRRAALGACVMNGFHAAIIAQENYVASYFDIACKRVQDVVDRPPLFTPEPPKPVQEGFDL